MWTIGTLGHDDLSSVRELASRSSVVELSDHLSFESERMWERFVTTDPHRGATVGARTADGRLVAAAQLVVSTHRRRIHTGDLWVLADGDAESDAPLKAVVSRLIESADKWMQIGRLQLDYPAGHPRLASVFANLGFVPEVVRKEAVYFEGAYRDRAVLGRVLHPSTPTASADTSAAKPKATPLPVEVRPARADDGEAMRMLMGEPSVVWGTMQLPDQPPHFWDHRFAQNHPYEIASVLALHPELGLVGSGAIALNGNPRTRHVGLLGISVSDAVQGRRVGSQLLESMLTMADRELALRRIELEVYPDNVAGLRLYERCGFAHEGKKRSVAMRDGELADTLVMGRIRP